MLCSNGLISYLCMCTNVHCVWCVRYLHCVRMFVIFSGANVHAETATKDTAITYACANGHTNVAALLLDYGADLVWTAL